jgi:hypothetical protein
MYEATWLRRAGDLARVQMSVGLGEERIVIISSLAEADW